MKSSESGARLTTRIQEKRCLLLILDAENGERENQYSQ